MRRHGVVSMLALLAVACATPGQVRRVETSVMMMETANRKADSLNAARLAQINSLITDFFGKFNTYAANTSANIDSLKQNDRNQAYQLLEQGKTMYALQVLAGQNAADLAKSQAAIRSLNDDLNRAPRPVDSMGQPTGGQGVSADTYIQIAERSAARGSYSEQRLNLRMVIDSFPASPLVPKALLDMARSFVPMSVANPDSQRFYFAQVYTKFPKSDEAPVALYKLAQLAEPTDKRKAREWYLIIFNNYKGTPEHTRADDWLKKNPN